MKIENTKLTYWNTTKCSSRQRRFFHRLRFSVNYLWYLQVDCFSETDRSLCSVCGCTHSRCM